MAMVVKNNIPAKNTLNQLDKNDKALAKSLKKVASGMKINSAADDASGFSISEKMRVQINSLDQDYDNAQTGNSMLKVAEGGLQSSVDILRTLKEKVINAANDSNTDEDRATIQKELNQAVDQLDENAGVTYNGKTMLDGSKNNEVIAPGTSTAFVNENLDSNITDLTKLTDLKDSSGRSLEIKADSKIEISYVQQGETKTITLDPVANTRLVKLIGNCTPAEYTNALESRVLNPVGNDRTGGEVNTVGGNDAFCIRAMDPGLEGQIAGLTFNVVEKDGSINKTANSILNNFYEAIQAEEPSDDNALSFQIGTKSNQTVKIGFSDMRSTALGLRGDDGTTLSIGTREKANAAISAVDLALEKVLRQQTTIGAVRNRLDYTSSNITTASENTQASESVIRDANMAKEMTDYTKNNVITQAAQSMLAQANQNSSQVLQLLQ